MDRIFPGHTGTHNAQPLQRLMSIVTRKLQPGFFTVIFLNNHVFLQSFIPYAVTVNQRFNLLLIIIIMSYLKKSVKKVFKALVNKNLILYNLPPGVRNAA